MPTDLPPLRDVIARHNLGARHSLGQHFLFDSNLCRRIAQAGGNLTDCNVIEIGPGPGGLTRAILESGAKSVTAIEKDSRCIAALNELADHFPGRLNIIEGDALEIDETQLVPAPRRIIANLPYNVATPLLINWLKRADAFDGLTLMFQKEVADRLVAKPRTKAYGRLSIITQWMCDIRFGFNIDRRAFTPPPKVTSAVVLLTPHAPAPADATFAAMETVTAAAFGQRRKMLRSSLKSLGLDPAAADIPPTARAEELTVPQFCALARAWAEKTKDED
ncbi:MAG: 16S rRNA (adenine(1518)-N(6)/adenine(1519)-N(6))-dimethyltransferase RsmA [Rhodospirillales bacterium]|nr:16S rRNA (adenine(1518)-N(6)/adenine(1519)-N(6))-dimethyltransferase RsmA [Rhodospirillales bacterium]